MRAHGARRGRRGCRIGGVPRRVLVLESSGTTRRRNAVGALCAAMLLLYVLALSLAGMRDFFDLVVPGFWSLVAIAGGTGLTITGLVFTDERFVADLGVKPFAR